MITVRKELVCPVAEATAGESITRKSTKNCLNPCPSCRIYVNASGNAHHFYIEDDCGDSGRLRKANGWNERLGRRFKLDQGVVSPLPLTADFQMNILRTIE